MKINDETITQAIRKALNTEILPGVKIDDYLSYTVDDAVELGVGLDYVDYGGTLRPRFNNNTDIRADEYDDVNTAILKPLVKAVLSNILSSQPVGYLITHVDETEKDFQFMPLSEPDKKYGYVETPVYVVVEIKGE